MKIAIIGKPGANTSVRLLTDSWRNIVQTAEYEYHSDDWSRKRMIVRK